MISPAAWRFFPPSARERIFHLPPLLILKVFSPCIECVLFRRPFNSLFNQRGKTSDYLPDICGCPGNRAMRGGCLHRCGWSTTMPLGKPATLGKSWQGSTLGLQELLFLSVWITYRHAAWLSEGLCAYRGGGPVVWKPHWCCSNNSNGCTVVRNQDRSNWFKHTGLRRLSSSCISSIMRPDRCYCASNAAFEEAGSKKVIENLTIKKYVLKSSNITYKAPLKQGE